MKLDQHDTKPAFSPRPSLENNPDYPVKKHKTELGKETAGVVGKSEAKEGKKRGKYAPRSKSPKKKDEGSDPKSGKPFKRQSYHVAVAYQVYMRLHASGVRPNADPTLFARQLKSRANAM